MSGGNVLGLFGALSEMDCRRAVSICFVRIKTAHRLNNDQLGSLLECSGKTIANAINEETTLNFFQIALAAQRFPDEFKVIESLWKIGAAQEPTPAETIGKIEALLQSLERKVA